MGCQQRYVSWVSICARWYPFLCRYPVAFLTLIFLPLVYVHYWFKTSYMTTCVWLLRLALLDASLRRSAYHAILLRSAASHASIQSHAKGRTLLTCAAHNLVRASYVLDTSLNKRSKHMALLDPAYAGSDDADLALSASACYSPHLVQADANSQPVYNLTPCVFVIPYVCPSLYWCFQMDSLNKTVVHSQASACTR